ncbi:hypothetical protein EPN83_00120 [Patescibacteria group bacterium]|nr:MAG: hypothetical protein EPN83_00120 [Patescibacteria group bacterium]
MRIGIKLLVEPGTRVPKWVRNQTLNVEVGRESLNGRIVRSLKIRKGETSFFPGGGVVVKMPGSDEFWVAFQPMKVLEIRDLKGNLIKRNHYLCTECATLTGKVENHKPSDVAGLVDADFKCTQCRHQWELKRI